MEGVVDADMRDLLTQVGGYDYCVTEFVRVSERRLPAKVFHRLAPELLHDGRTAAGTRVIVQILGGEPWVMAANAKRAAALGAAGVDINFGCPSKWTTRRDGGAILLREPERIFDIVHAVRQAVDPAIAVSAKMRLGYEDTLRTLEIVDAITEGGANFVTVHARTKVDGYKPPAKWEWLARIRQHTHIPVIANGDIASVDDFVRCQEISGCDRFMLGRGAVAQPDLALQIKLRDQHQIQHWDKVLPLLQQLVLLMQQNPEFKHQQIKGRIKQWFSFLHRIYPEADALYLPLKRTEHLDEVKQLLGMASTTILSDKTTTPNT